MKDSALEIAKMLADARRTQNPLSQDLVSKIADEAHAYQIQASGVELMRQSGDRTVGLKMGFTSRAKMQQMGVQDMIFGQLAESMVVQDGGEVFLQNYIHPRVEPEIAFLMKDEIPDDVANVNITAYVEAVAPALEIIDSRFKNFKFDLPLVIADNTSAAGFVIGTWRKPTLDLSNLGMILKSGTSQSVGSSAAILGNPWRSLIALVRLSRKYGQKITPGAIVLAGSATPAIEIAPDVHHELQVSGLGRVSFFSSIS